MLASALERIVEIVTGNDGGRDLERARQVFFERTGEFEGADPWYESRIQFFFDWYVCDWLDPSSAFALEESDRRVFSACRSAARGLYRATSLTPEGRWLVQDDLGGGRFRVHAEGRLHQDDVFDGRLVPLDDVVHLAPGVIFHPAEAHVPLAAIIAEVRSQPFRREEVLDGLLRMRMRHDRFTSIRAEHIYRYEALADPNILSAGWARRPSD